MKHLLTAAFGCLILWLTSCSSKTKETLFAEQHGLEKYDTIYVVSCISCGGCMEDYLGTRLSTSTGSILVYDEQCTLGKHIRELRKYRHVSVTQQELEKVFGEFGNMMIIRREGDRYLSRPYPY